MPTLEEIIKTYGTIPELSEFKRPMFVGPHPDDIEFGCGALLSKMKDKNAEPVFVIVTDGGAGTPDPNVTPKMLSDMRKEEAVKAAGFLGVEKVEFLDLPDDGEYTVEDIIKRLAPVVLKYKPDAIFAPDSHLRTECHPDHLKTGEAVRYITQIVPHPESLRRHNISIEGVEHFPDAITLALYFSDEPNALCEISEKNLEEKIAALMLHTSQVQDPSIGLLLNYFKLKAVQCGKNSATGLAEEYQVLVPLTQHVYSSGIHY